MNSVEKFFERAALYGVAYMANNAAGLIATNAPKFTELAGTGAPVVVADAIALLEKDDVKLGPIALEINLVLSANESEIEALVQPLIAQGVAFFPALENALKQFGANKQAQANALK